jgi:hypothetical protein
MSNGGNEGRREPETRRDTKARDEYARRRRARDEIYARQKRRVHGGTNAGIAVNC